MSTTETITGRDVHTIVRDRYAAAARQVTGNAALCCSTDDTCGCGDAAVIGEGWGTAMYATDQLTVLPDTAVLASLGCGNPTALAQLNPGEIVLDLGSGGGIDVLLSAKRVGATGKAYGLDMTDEMLDLARENQRKAGVTNVEFLRGKIEEIPLPRNSVDVIISNCVVNLSPDKDAVLREAYRVLKPGGRVAISDVVIRDADPGEPEIPEPVRRDVGRWTGCIAGALEAREYREKLAAAGFTDIEIQEVKRYAADELCGSECCGPAGTVGVQIDDAVASRFTSAFVRATKAGNAATLVSLPMMATASACGCGAEGQPVAGECCDDKAKCCGTESTCC
ncbi:MAG: arsenite methyltransferase [Thermomicrobia bacterium]|nr:arsenite methyltransferase [Thermomicrobia bacterium]MCA1723458.1 arsenite methyltransferase [Thermomicrobia bacterium]